MPTEQDYRNHPYVANSDLKRLKKELVGSPEIDNLEEIFAFGTLSHALILEPHLADYTHKDIVLGMEMRDTFMDDEFCQAFVEHPNFVPERHFYKKNILGINGKCMMDGSIESRKDILEFKSLAISTQSAFEEAIYHFDYDMGAAWYLDVSEFDRLLIVAVSKKKTKKLFKMIITRDHPAYISGLEKYTEWAERYKELFE